MKNRIDKATLASAEVSQEVLEALLRKFKKSNLALLFELDRALPLRKAVLGSPEKLTPLKLLSLDPNESKGFVLAVGPEPSPKDNLQNGWSKLSSLRYPSLLQGDPNAKVAQVLFAPFEYSLEGREPVSVMSKNDGVIAFADGLEASLRWQAAVALYNLYNKV